MKYDFIEIGASCFDNLIFQQPDLKGISIEPVKHYFDKLPDNPNCIKLNVGIGLVAGVMDAHYIDETEIKSKGIDKDIRGCIRLGEPHDQLAVVSGLFPGVEISVEAVKVITFKQLCDENDVTEVDFLKIDTEGMDFQILKSVKEVIESVDIKKIQFEFTFMSSEDINEVSKLFPNYTSVVDEDVENIILTKK